MVSTLKKYALYEESVQSPERDLPWLAEIFRAVFKKEARHLREDFCGTFKLSTEWVKRDVRNTALCLDLDDEPLAYGRARHLARLRPAARKRLKILKQNVLSFTAPRTDLIIAFNFSFFIFKQRKLLVEYLRYCLRSLKSKGMVVFEMAGGPGMIQITRETKTVYKKDGKRKYTYIWDQKSFNPISREGRYAIHFKFPNGRQLKDAFIYEWRIWTIPEIREAMIEAGFQETQVYWEVLNKRERTTEFIRSEEGDNDWSWITYVTAIKR